MQYGLTNQSYQHLHIIYRATELQSSLLFSPVQCCSPTHQFIIALELRYTDVKYSEINKVQWSSPFTVFYTQCFVFGWTNSKYWNLKSTENHTPLLYINLQATFYCTIEYCTILYCTVFISRPTSFAKGCPRNTFFGQQKMYLSTYVVSSWVSIMVVESGWSSAPFLVTVS